ncbi:hypothetical protein [Cytobacillus horneckiae]|uniref:hypothetical protein n=1 Tax=Cytobacillus horneckiae TaxID=549687 RepID=UPI003D9A6E9A
MTSKIISIGIILFLVFCLLGYTFLYLADDYFGLQVLSTVLIFAFLTVNTIILLQIKELLKRS